MHKQKDWKKNTLNWLMIIALSFGILTSVGYIAVYISNAESTSNMIKITNQIIDVRIDLSKNITDFHINLSKNIADSEIRIKDEIRNFEGNISVLTEKLNSNNIDIAILNEKQNAK